MKFLKNLIVCAIISLPFHLAAQNSVNLRISSGTADIAKGYYCSFDAGVSPIKSLEFGLGFTSVNTIPTGFRSVGYQDGNNAAVTHVSTDESTHADQHGYALNSFDFNLYFKPMDLCKSDKLHRHEPFVAGGFGLKHYAIISSMITEADGLNKLYRIDYKVNSGLGANFKLGYNYYFTTRFSAGIAGALIGFDGDAATLLGLQVGVKL